MVGDGPGGHQPGGGAPMASATALRLAPMMRRSSASRTMGRRTRRGSASISSSLRSSDRSAALRPRFFRVGLRLANRAPMPGAPGGVGQGPQFRGGEWFLEVVPFRDGYSVLGEQLPHLAAAASTGPPVKGCRAAHWYSSSLCRAGGWPRRDGANGGNWAILYPRPPAA